MFRTFQNSECGWFFRKFFKSDVVKLSSIFSCFRDKNWRKLFKVNFLGYVLEALFGFELPRSKVFKNQNLRLWLCFLIDTGVVHHQLSLVLLLPTSISVRMHGLNSDDNLFRHFLHFHWEFTSVWTAAKNSNGKATLFFIMNKQIGSTRQKHETWGKRGKLCENRLVFLLLILLLVHERKIGHQWRHEKYEMEAWNCTRNPAKNLKIHFLSVS